MGLFGFGKMIFLNVFFIIDMVLKGEILIDGKDIVKMNDDELVFFCCNYLGFIF